MTYEEKMALVCQLADMKKKVQTWTNQELDKSQESIDTHELGQAADIIKDFAEAEKFCMESMYYESVIEAMNSTNEDYRMGYGKMSKVHPYYPDRVMFKPMMDEEPYIEDYLMGDDQFGYDGGRGSSGGRSGGSRGGNRGGSRGQSSSGVSSNDSMVYQNGRENYDSRRDMPRYGRAYEDYREARRHYTESKNPADKDEMSAMAQEHVMETVSSMRDIWKTADPSLKTQMKNDLQRLLSEMN